MLISTSEPGAQPPAGGCRRVRAHAAPDPAGGEQGRRPCSSASASMATGPGFRCAILQTGRAGPRWCHYNQEEAGAASPTTDGRAARRCRGEGRQRTLRQPRCRVCSSSLDELYLPAPQTRWCAATADGRSDGIMRELEAQAQPYLFNCAGLEERQTSHRAPLRVSWAETDAGQAGEGIDSALALTGLRATRRCRACCAGPYGADARARTTGNQRLHCIQ